MSSNKSIESTVRPAVVTVLGGGAFGTAMAQLMGRQGSRVNLWIRDVEVRAEVNIGHENKSFLPGCPLAETVVAPNTIEECFEGTELILLVVPTPYIREFIVSNREKFPVGVPIICCSKGIEQGTLDTPFEILRDELPGKYAKYLGCVSGPSFAQELARGQPTNLTCACVDPEFGVRVQHMMSDQWCRLYTSPDIMGCELAGAVKNVLAIACGASDGLGFGNNARAALITRGLAEMSRLVVAKGGDAKTLLGLPGVGDLVLTCTATMSRNFTFGQRLAKGETMEEIRSSTKAIAEGVFTAVSIHQMKDKYNIDMPICEGVYKTLYEGIPLKEALKHLQSRKLKQDVDVV